MYAKGSPIFGTSIKAETTHVLPDTYHSLSPYRNIKFWL